MAAALRPIGGLGKGRTTSMTIRVLLVDDHQLIREGLRRAFDTVR